MKPPSSAQTTQRVRELPASRPTTSCVFEAMLFHRRNSIVEAQIERRRVRQAALDLAVVTQETLIALGVISIAEQQRHDMAVARNGHFQVVAIGNIDLGNVPDVVSQ